jgi:hypothetical protein
MSNENSNVFSVVGSDVRILNQTNDGKKVITCPIVRRRSDSQLVVDEGLFATNQTGTLMTMAAFLGFQTPEKQGKSLYAVIKNAKAITVANIPGRRLSQNANSTYGPWTPGMVVQCQDDDAIKLAIDASAVRIYQSRADGAPRLNTVTGVFAIELDAYVQLMGLFGGFNVSQQVAKLDQDKSILDLAVWEDSVKFVVANGAVLVKKTFDNGDTASTYAMPRGTQRTKLIESAQELNSVSLAADPIDHMNTGSRTVAVQAVTTRPASGRRVSYRNAR